MAAINLAEIYVDEEAEVITQAPICEAINIQWLDGLEYHMGLKRLAANSLGKSNPSFQVTARTDIFHALCTQQCALLSASQTVGAVEKLFWNNYEARTHKRVLYDTVIPSSDKYTYTLFFPKTLHLRTASGALCESAKTTVTTTLHPCIAAVLAGPFDFRFHKEHAMALIMQENIEPLIDRPIWDSFFDPPHYFGRPVECVVQDTEDRASREQELYDKQTARLAKRIKAMIAAASDSES